MISLKHVPPRPTADTAYEHLSADGWILFDEPNGQWTIWKRNQAVPTGTEEERP